MTNEDERLALLPINSQAHRKHGWQRLTNLSHASNDYWSPITTLEMTRLLPNYVMAFARIAQEEFCLCVIQGLSRNENLYLDHDGRWLVQHYPDRYAVYPFVLRELAGDEQKRHMVCFNMNSGLYRETLSDATEENGFFDEAGKPSAQFQKIIDRLNAIAAAQNHTLKISNAIASAGILTPFSLSHPDVQDEDQIRAMYRIDESALKRLSSDEFEKLRHADALPAIYAQIFSMRRGDILEILKKMQTKPQPTPNQPTIQTTLDNQFGIDSSFQIDFSGYTK